MKKILCVFTFIFCFYGLAISQQSGFGLGIMLGEPTGLSAKGWISQRSAVDAGLAWSFVDEGSIHIHADYLYHFYNVFETPGLHLYLGVGGRIKMSNSEHNTDTRLGVRVPFGITYQFEETPVDVFFEIVPVLDLNPSTRGSINGAIGVRYYFK